MDEPQSVVDALADLASVLKHHSEHGWRDRHKSRNEIPIASKPAGKNAVKVYRVSRANLRTVLSAARQAQDAMRRAGWARLASCKEDCEKRRSRAYDAVCQLVADVEAAVLHPTVFRLPKSPTGYKRMFAAAVRPAPAEVSTGGKRKRGRKLQSDPGEDRKIAEAWATGEHKTYEGLARERGTTATDIERALGRHRKREKRKGN